jgi:5-methyltetrahydropteroyltriglutamate--homocysteine methyltransferase
MQTYAYGFPRLGKNREYKTIIENFWTGKVEERQLQEQLCILEEERLATYEKYVDKFPVGEMTLYDNMLDTALIFGVYEGRELNDYYNLCRGKSALTLTKWFNTNYHYLVPEFKESFDPSGFHIAWNKPEAELKTYKKGIPYLVGPFTFLKLSRGIKPGMFKEYFLSLADVYAQLIQNIEEVHIEEPAFVVDLSGEEIDWIKQGYEKLGDQNRNINLFTYYDSVDFLKELYDLPIKAIGLDFINGKENLAAIREHGFPQEKTLIAGVVDGRNVWKTDIEGTLGLLKNLSEYSKNLIVSNAAPLYHLPITTEGEELDDRLLKNIAFAQERMEELSLIARIYEGDKEVAEGKRETVSDFGKNVKVQERIKGLTDADFKKDAPYALRAAKQNMILDLPVFPVTTIGSFPQTPQVRQKRALFRSGKISQEEYTAFIRKEIARSIRLQEDTGLDVLVHGEFERTDMVEFFAQKLNGIATSKKGWIISYGTRVYRPAIIYGDVSRPEPMTLKEIVFAQSLTKKPVKGMLTGPVTITAWSFVRNDIPVYEVAYQIALCLQDEIKDYEKEGIKIVQIDEPAFKEKAPVKKSLHGKYFDWAVKSFNLASQSKPETQIHTHMCYSEFTGVIKHILSMDFDVITIETSRSKGEIIEVFRGLDFDRQIGLGVWDIHSPMVSGVDDMADIVKRVSKIIPKENLWINPDCGLKTRGWEETIIALKNLVRLGKQLREE